MAVWGNGDKIWQVNRTAWRICKSSEPYQWSRPPPFVDRLDSVLIKHACCTTRADFIKLSVYFIRSRMDTPWHFLSFFQGRQLLRFDFCFEKKRIFSRELLFRSRFFFSFKIDPFPKRLGTGSHTSYIPLKNMASDTSCLKNK